MPAYPSMIFNPSLNVDNSTVVNAAYMNLRDDEIKAIENALGIGLVPGTGGYTLASRVKVDASGNLILAYGGGNVGIGTPSPNYNLDIVGAIDEVGLRVGDDGTKVFRMLWDNSVDEGVIDSWYSGSHHPIRISGSVIKLTGGNVDIVGASGEVGLRVGDDGTKVFRMLWDNSVDEGVIDSWYSGSHHPIRISGSVIKLTSGNVGIGSFTTDPTRILTIQQNSATDPIADAWTTYSSRRWKTNIQSIEGALDKVQRLRGVSFDWKVKGKRDIGLIAEEVGEVVPEVVVYEKNGLDAQSIDYARLVALLIEATKELASEYGTLKQRLEPTTMEVKELKSKMAQIESTLQGLEALATDRENAD